MAPRPITFLSDYGLEDEFAGVCRAVIARIAPDAPVIDLTHAIPRHDVRRGAAALERALPYSPPGVHLAVVDPGVGTERRPVAVRVAEDERILVGPDNGLLSPSISLFGGAVEAADLSRSPFRLLPVSATFHGRDVFAPVAAHLALGAPLAEAGNAIGPEPLSRAHAPGPSVESGRLVAHVSDVDGFGNLALDATPSDLDQALDSERSQGPDRGGASEAVVVELGGFEHRATRARAFADVPEGALLVYEDSSDRLALAVNRGNAASSLGVEPGEELVIRPIGAPQPGAPAQP